MGDTMIGGIELKRPWARVRREWLISLFLAISVVAVYYPVVSFDFVNLDDNVYVTGNRHVQYGLSLKNIIWAFTSTSASNWHPISWLSHLLDVELFGLDAGMHHFVNLLFHILNALLLFHILRQMTGDLWPSCFAAVIFALHPLQVESVVWISERKNVLSTFFWMMTLWAYIRYVDRSSTFHYWAALLFFSFGLMAKPMLVTMPFVLLLLDYWPLGRAFRLAGTSSANYTPNRRKIEPRIIREKIPFFVLTTVSCIVTYLVQKSSGAVKTLDICPVVVRIENMLISYMEYLIKFIWPFPLAVFYPIPKEYPVFRIILAGSILAALSIFIYRTRRQRPYLAVGWLWFLGTLIPVIGIVQIGMQAMADRYAYVPMIGILIIIAWGIPNLLSRWRFDPIGLKMAGGTAALYFAVCTWSHVPYWTNSITLFKHALASTSDNYVIHNNLANVLEWNGHAVEAKMHYLEALRINPNLLMARYNLGNLLKSEGRITEAVTQYREVIRMNPDYAPAHNNLATALIRVAEIGKVIDDYAKLTESPKDSAAVRNQLTAAQGVRDSLDEAIDHFREALRITPDSDRTSKNIKQALLFRKQIDEVMINLQDALKPSQKTES